ncbi:hypothetical protein SELMODRAFT_429843 [Selaginella moellendorffii]|uniref:Secreted protein n=1 Tax=Selaginella moellendorffii TaxID=88036 RepID=D8T7H9_SELML|nr:hypothetical protein SELMODRAFT_429843 [Selaginella moellendorffii]
MAMIIVIVFASSSIPTPCHCSVGVQLTCGLIEVIQQADILCNTCQDVDMYGLEFVPRSENETLVVYQGRGCPSASVLAVFGQTTSYNWQSLQQHRERQIEIPSP